MKPTMKLLLYSDLHLDLQPLELQLDPALLASTDIVVLAGDIAEGVKGMHWARTTFPDHPIIYVDGNHEFYGDHWDRHIDVMRTLASALDVQYLECDTLSYGGVRFLGCTLWTDFALNGESDAAMADALRMSDYHQIQANVPLHPAATGLGTLAPRLVKERHDRSKRWLEEQLNLSSDGPTVVVSHHAPHPTSVPSEHRSHPRAPCYASDLGDLLGKPTCWIHGHIHSSVDYRVNGTRVVSNPRGYRLAKGQGMQNPGFRQDFVVEV